MAPFRPWLTTATLCLSSVWSVSAYADTVTGKVVGPDGKPVAGAKIFANFYSPTAAGRLDSKTLISDVSGAFSLDVSPFPNQKEKNPAVAIVYAAAPGFGLAQAMLTLNSGEGNTIRLEKGIAVRGKVVDSAGEPVAGVEVRLWSVYLGGSRGSGSNYLWLRDDFGLDLKITAKTDAKGVWTMADIPATAVHANVALADPKYVQVASEIPVGAANPKPLVALPAAVLVGKVVGSDGKPRAGINVSARPENYGQGTGSARTAADGSYRIAGLPTGAFTVWVNAPMRLVSGATKPSEEVAAPLRQVSITAGKETTVPNLVLLQGGLVEGSVTDAVDGKPLSGVTVSVMDSMGAYGDVISSSGPDGRFALRLPPGKHRLITSELEGYLSSTETGEENAVLVTIKDGETVPFSFRLARALTLSGVAQDASGNPVSGVDITVMEQGNPPKATTDSEGRWTLKGIRPGNLRLVGGNDYEVFAGNEVSLSLKDAPPPVVLKVKPFRPAPATGRVVTSDGKPVVGLTIQAQTKMSMGGGGYWFHSEERRTDNQGRFTLPAIRPENPDIELKFNKPGYKVASGGTVTRQEDRFVIADTVLSALDAGRTLKGRVVDAAGKPVADAIVAVPDAETGPGETRTTATGSFALAGVPESSQVLAARGALFGAVSVSRTTGAVVIHLAPVKKAQSNAAEDRARAVAILWGIKKRSLAAKRQNARGDYFTADEPPYAIAPLDFPLALALAKPEGTNPVDDQTLAQMIRVTAKHNPARIKDWAIPALKDIGVTAVRASAAYEVVLDTPPGPEKLARAKQVYQDMQVLTLTGSEHWVVRRITQMAVLAGMLGMPEESRSWLDKAIAAAKADPSKPYISVVAYEAFNGGLPMIRYLLTKVEAKSRVDLYWISIRMLARINARAAQKLLAEMEADTTLPVRETRDGGALLELVRALAPQDPGAALKIAEQLQGNSYQSAALALTARHQPDLEKATRLYERAASLQEASYNPEVLAKIAALAWQSSPALGKKLFSRAKQRLLDRDAGADTFWYYSLVKLAGEYYEFAPGESRLLLALAAPYLLSADAIKKDEYGNYRQSLAMGWLFFNVDRAVSIAEMLPEKQAKGNSEIRNETMAQIATWLLTDPTKRSKLLLSDHDQYGFDPYDY
ncbi:MAG: carboxypeptidase regulatory-like domain-containing protein [Armatimonadota bacterium]